MYLTFKKNTLSALIVKKNIPESTVIVLAVALSTYSLVHSCTTTNTLNQTTITLHLCMVKYVI